MHIGVLGTGRVGQTLAAKLLDLGHQVWVGTRQVNHTQAVAAGNEPSFASWQASHPTARLVTFADAAAAGEIIINCTPGTVSLEALRMAGEANRNGKVVVDLANPLVFTPDQPVTLSVCNTDSVGEQIQHAFPRARVVKALNTMNASLMVDPARLAQGRHTVFLCGNDTGAKGVVVDLLQSFGWEEISDLGDITGARGMEMILPIWLRRMGSFGSPWFNFHVVH